MSKNSEGRLILSQGGGDSYEDEYHEGTVVESERKSELKQPPMYQVVMLDDDYTPMDFVVEVLCEFFHVDKEKATRIMMLVHTKGKASCGTFSKDVAETKVGQVIRYARDNQHPLLCKAEPVSE